MKNKPKELYGLWPTAQERTAISTDHVPVPAKKKTILRKRVLPDKPQEKQKENV